ncbi:MAG: hypothetical protein H6625_05560 [Bdellovibrionaceae bacterium]|nr:hypothetical protein [Pseudobdellovibrionaceae bacterium]
MRFIVIALIFLFLSQSFALCVSSDIANLRIGPGQSFSVSLTVGKYTPLLEIGGEKGWYKVRYLDGSIHWVYNSLVSTRMKCVAVKTNKANLRTGPGTKFPFAAYQIADKYFPFKRINQKDDWYNLLDASGNKFWLHKSTLWRPQKVSTIKF